MAPEILEGFPHRQSCDMWSVGIILYLMLSGRFPFDLKNLEHEIINTPVLFPKGLWGNISDDCQNFILRLLTKEPPARISANQALNDPWFRILDDDPDHLEDSPHQT